MNNTAEFLMQLADTLDGWARDSQQGGWSTHQVEANRKKANECRTVAARLYRGQA